MTAQERYKRYRESEKGKARQKKYMQSEKGKAMIKKSTKKNYPKKYAKWKEYNRLYHLTYFKSEKGKVAYNKYKKSEKGKLASLKHSNIRHRKLGFILLKIYENIFDEPIEYHHINDMTVIPIPMELHKLYCGLSTDSHRFMVNQLIWQIYGVK